MTDIEQILYTSIATLVGGVLLFFLQGLIAKRFIEPINQLRECISNVQFTLSFFAQVIHTPISRNDAKSTETARALREQSARLQALLYLLPRWRLLRKAALLSLPSQENISEAAVQLRGLATYMHETGEAAADSVEQVNQRVDRIRRLLGFEESTSE